MFVSKIEETSCKHFYRLPNEYSRLEKLLILSITDALQKVTVDIKNDNMLVIISTTKGNIDLIEDETKRDKLYLSSLALVLKSHFQLKNQPIIISNACISGVLAIITANRMINQGKFDTIVVVGGGVLSEYTLCGFLTLKAISSTPCRPYDKDRDGITLGEACGTIVLSKNKESAIVEVLGGSISNDANHISGPSRTGDGLKLAIDNAIHESKIKAKDVDYISAHGTATLYNDEMESLAFSSCGLSETPLNSFKGHWGHTLGAAGIIESIGAINSLVNNSPINSLGCSEVGVSKTLNVIKGNNSLTNNDYLLKTASGFGGCNAAVVFKNCR